MFGRFRQLFSRGNVLTFELEEWHKWYKEPQKLHEAVVEHLEKEGHQVETISVMTTVRSNQISTLLLDGVKYEMSIDNLMGLGPTQTVTLTKIES